MGNGEAGGAHTPINIFALGAVVVGERVRNTDYSLLNARN
jgi:hypothetical protein